MIFFVYFLMHFILQFSLTFILIVFLLWFLGVAGGGRPFLRCPPAERLWPEIRYRSRRSAPAGKLWTENRFVFDALLRLSIPSPEESPPLTFKIKIRCTEHARYSGLTIPNMYYQG